MKIITITSNRDMIEKDINKVYQSIRVTIYIPPCNEAIVKCIRNTFNNEWEKIPNKILIGLPFSNACISTYLGDQRKTH